MDALFSKTIKAGDRTYFIDVKEAKNKSKYLTIAETKPSKEGEKKFTRSSVMIFDNQAEKFRDALEQAMQMLKK
jgi:hypothetical protein